MNNFWEGLPDDLKSNPFFHFSEDTNYVPAWDKIRIADAVPAMDYAIDLLRRRAGEIARNKSKPTFRNTAEALENSFSLAGYFYRILYAITPQDEEEEKLREQIEDATWKKYYAAYLEVFSNKALFDRFQKMTESPAAQKWTLEKQMNGGMYWNGFVENGIRMAPEKAALYHKLQRDSADLSLKIHQNMRRAEQDILLYAVDPARFGGLPEDMVRLAADRAAKEGQPGAWAFSTGRVPYQTFMSCATDRDLRHEMWTAHHTACMQGPYDNRDLIMKYMDLEHQAAQLMSRRSPANKIAQYNMAKTPQAISVFLQQLRNVSKPFAQYEANILGAFAAQNFQYDTVEAWDTEFLKEHLKKASLGFDQEDTRAYFELENTLNGTFAHFQKLTGMKFIPSDRYPNYHEDVRIYEVVNARSGRSMGTLVLDMFDRKGKMPGIAWNMSILSQGFFEGKVRRAVDQINCKFTKGADGKPTLLSFDDVQTLWHELGHACHNLRSQCRYQSRSGTSTDTDFVEFPSQIQESWLYKSDVLDSFARHWQTGKNMPGFMKDGIAKLPKFMAGTSILERAMRGWLDLSWYQKNPKSSGSLEKFEDKVTSTFRLPNKAYPYLSPRFSYIFGGGYDSAFYSYQWSQMISDEVFDAFEKKGLYNPALKAKFIKALEMGGSEDEYKLFQNITGKKMPSLKPFFRRAGLTGKGFDYSPAFSIPESANQNAEVPKELLPVPKPF